MSADWAQSAAAGPGHDADGAGGGACSLAQPLAARCWPSRPALIIAAHALGRPHRTRCEDETLVLAGIVQIYYVRCGIFFGCLGLFMRLFRGEVVERTLHYLFLAPVRRELWSSASSWRGARLDHGSCSAPACWPAFVLMYGHFDGRARLRPRRPGLAHLRQRTCWSTALACLGYGAVFLPAEPASSRTRSCPPRSCCSGKAINGVLPAWLKHLSVTFYLKPLFPVELPGRGFELFFGVMAELLPPPIAVAGLLLFSALALAVSCWRVRRLEVSYATD